MHSVRKRQKNNSTCTSRKGMTVKPALLSRQNLCWDGRYSREPVTKGPGKDCYQNHHLTLPVNASCAAKLLIVVPTKSKGSVHIPGNGSACMMTTHMTERPSAPGTITSRAGPMIARCHDPPHRPSPATPTGRVATGPAFPRLPQGRASPPPHRVTTVTRTAMRAETARRPARGNAPRPRTVPLPRPQAGRLTL
jgi:hypothetical protein